MAKNKMIKRREEEIEEDFDFFSDMTSAGDEAVVGMMSRMVAVSNHQQQMAMELTKLIVEKNATEHITEEKVFSIFKRATGVVTENFPLKALLEKFN